MHSNGDPILQSIFSRFAIHYGTFCTYIWNYIFGLFCSFFGFFVSNVSLSLLLDRLGVFPSSSFDLSFLASSLSVSLRITCATVTPPVIYQQYIFKSSIGVLHKKILLLPTKFCGDCDMKTVVIRHVDKSVEPKCVLLLWIQRLDRVKSLQPVTSGGGAWYSRSCSTLAQQCSRVLVIEVPSTLLETAMVVVVKVWHFVVLDWLDRCLHQVRRVYLNGVLEYYLYAINCLIYQLAYMEKLD